MTDTDLAGFTVLVVEDEYYTADDLRRELVGAGATVLGPAPSLERALDLIRSSERIDAAILDINLNGEMVFPAATLLHQRGVPIVFATGYDRTMIPPRFDDAIRCEKPVDPHSVRRALSGVRSRD